jgi:hypothetical protein
MIRSENVHCSSASVVPSFWLSGPVNKVHTYWGDEIAIIAIRPRTSWHQRFQYHAIGTVEFKAVTTSPPQLIRRSNQPQRELDHYWSACPGPQWRKITQRGLF